MCFTLKAVAKAYTHEPKVNIPYNHKSVLSPYTKFVMQKISDVTFNTGLTCLSAVSS